MSCVILPDDDPTTTWYLGQCTNPECKKQLKFLKSYVDYEDAYKYGYYFRLTCISCWTKFNCNKQKFGDADIIVNM